MIFLRGYRQPNFQQFAPSGGFIQRQPVNFRVFKMKLDIKYNFIAGALWCSPGPVRWESPSSAVCTIFRTRTAFASHYAQLNFLSRDKLSASHKHQEAHPAPALI